MIDALSRVLVLGTLPGEESLRRVEYYAHPRNLFWPIVFALFGETPPAGYADRLSFIAAHRIALWDVCGAAQRIASADANTRRQSQSVPCDIHVSIAAINDRSGGRRY